jgi:hypothetical protein
MKKMILFVLLAATTGGILFAQADWHPRPVMPERPAVPDAITIRGTLGLSDGRIAVISGDTIYYVRGLGRYIGFIDGLKEGALVSLEGFVFNPRNPAQKTDAPKVSIFRPVKLTLNGKIYEVGPTEPNRFMPGPDHRYGNPGMRQPRMPQHGMPHHMIPRPMMPPPRRGR